MQSAGKTKVTYHEDLKQALADSFLRETLDKIAVNYRTTRERVFSVINEKEIVAGNAAAKDYAMDHYDELFEQFKREATKRGAIVHYAATGAEANAIIANIAKEHNVKLVSKTKTLTSKEILLNPVLEAQGCEVVEGDLGEWILQLRDEGPCHLVLPAMHLSRHQVAQTFSDVTNFKQEGDIAKLVMVARRVLRLKFVAADMGITGANFIVAETGTVGICTNEGNARLVTTLPRVQVSLGGLDKMVSTMRQALNAQYVLARNGTGQPITSYVTMMSGAMEHSQSPNKKKIYHIVILDNGRKALAKDPLCREALRCIRCGACANICPVYRMVGGHAMGHVYMGAIGLILTYFYHGKDKARNIIQNCINCEACKAVCAGSVNLPAVIAEIRARLNEEDGSPIESSLLAKVLSNRKLFHTLLRFGKWAQKPMTVGTPYIRHLPEIFLKGQGFRALPAIADKPFRDMWDKLKTTTNPNAKVKVGIFAGCAQDFIYPEHLTAAVKMLTAKGYAVDFPMGQTCCGLPVQMMGERKAAEDVAKANLNAFDAPGYDYILCLCASCASHLAHSYPRVLRNYPELAAKVQQFTQKIKDFSSFMRDVAKLSPADFNKSSEGVCYHAPCHLCRGMGVTEQPRALIDMAANYKQGNEEDVCCGFGGSYSIKFPEIASQVLDKKLTNLEATGASTLVTDCPGCVIQLRGGEEKRGKKLKVEHISELLVRQLK
ncbi:MAG: LUD domain-containing protein [Desulfovibrio sp.]|jgi:iron-sulfur cluster protein|nr:LUD domain-containing protein [Desulfovibrio sp.]